MEKRETPEIDLHKRAGTRLLWHSQVQCLLLSFPLLVTSSLLYPPSLQVLNHDK